MGKSLSIVLVVLFPAMSLAILTPQAQAQVGGQWVPQGPGPNTNGQVENLGDDEVVGAVNSIAAHPTDANIFYAASVNGGVWRTGDATAASPNWVPLTNDQESQSMGAIEFDPTDATANTLLAGFGRFSSLGRDGGRRLGVIRTTDDGASWTLLDGGGVLAGQNVVAVAPRGAVLVVATNAADSGGPNARGIYRSTDTGATFVQVSDAGAANGLPLGSATELTGDPLDPTRLFTIILPVAVGSDGGIFESTDTGATWTKISDGAIDALLLPSTSTADLAVGRSSNIFAAVSNGGTLSGVFHTADFGGTWNAMSLPGGTLGIHPGGQASIHFSIAADPSNANLVYIGGDRQGFPTDVGAFDFSGRLFRGDASQPLASQWQHLTHSNAFGAAGGGTASRSAPHADSRDMAIDAAGELIESDDGGIYRRTSPQDNTGDWFSMNGTLQTAEQHSSAYDSVSNVSTAGAQDTGTAHQLTPNNLRWLSVSTADGGQVTINDTGTPGQSTRYTSNQGLGGFARRVYNAGNTVISQTSPALQVVGGGDTLAAQFYTPIEVNAVDPTRLLIGGANSVYESLDEGDTISEAGPGVIAQGTFFSPLVYGNAGNAELIWVGTAEDIFIRTAASPAPLVATGTYPGTGARDVVLDPADSSRGFAIDTNQVFSTSDGGVSWTDITGNLDALSIRCMVYLDSPRGAAIAVGTREIGVMIAFEEDGFANWQTYGAGLPRSVIYELEFDPVDEVLTVATLGRGTFQMTDLFADLGIFADGFESGNLSAWSNTFP